MSKGKQYKWVPEETQFCIHMFADDKCGDENGWSCLVWGPRNLGQSWVRSYIVNTIDGNGNNRAPEKPSPPPQQKPSPPPQEDPQPPQPPPRATTTKKNEPPPPTRKNEPSKKPEPTGDRTSVGAGTEGPAAATTSSTREPPYEPELFAPAQKPGYHPSELDSKPTSLGGYPPPSVSAVAEKDAGGYSSWGHVAELADNSSHPMKITIENHPDYSLFLELLR
ncbi:predicted protein [Histoplasma mississippiense (nom. inval.)]|uniref:predicted protein n=1 Tax=Ajellomyces capsulatus (strain NAm1 / WU24) TaxID=2059318 RepID=UPI000157C2FE|nr:predicted protein [Histoplasma mississippiense (nom. inval.)]EDN07241.1 predicted protein [Histoplasma mississippiense (nom. inval.)]